MFEDIRYAVRQFLKTPGFTITAILTLALGIGATTAIFTLINAVLLKSLPVAQAERADPDRRQRELLHQRRHAGRLVAVFDRTVSAIPRSYAGVLQSGGVPGGADPGGRAPHGQQSCGRIVWRGVCLGQCVRDLRAERVDGPAAATVGRCEGRAAGGGDELSHLAGEIRERCVGGGGVVLHQRQRVHGRGHRAAGIFWGAADDRSTVLLDSPERQSGGFWWRFRRAGKPTTGLAEPDWANRARGGQEKDGSAAAGGAAAVPAGSGGQGGRAQARD